MARSRARLTRKRSWYSSASRASRRTPGRLAAGLGRPQVQELAAVVPVVDGLGGVDALVALQPDELAAGPGGEDLGHLGLADAGLALQQQRAAQGHGQEDRRRQPVVGEVPVGRQRGGDLGNGLRRGHGRRHGARLMSNCLQLTVDPRVGSVGGASGQEPPRDEGTEQDDGERHPGAGLPAVDEGAVDSKSPSGVKMTVLAIAGTVHDRFQRSFSCTPCGRQTMPTGRVPRDCRKETHPESEMRSHCVRRCHMTDATGASQYRAGGMARSPAPVDVTGQALLSAAHDLLDERGSDGVDGAAHRRRRRGEHDERVLPLRRQGRRARRAVQPTGSAASASRWRPRPRPPTRWPTCTPAARRTGPFARDNPTYYSLMFDRVVPDYRPVRRRPRQIAVATLATSRRASSGRWTPACSPAGDPFQVAMALWACEHGLVSLAARHERRRGAFDWDVVAPLGSAAMVRGLRQRRWVSWVATASRSASPRPPPRSVQLVVFDSDGAMRGGPMRHAS